MEHRIFLMNMTSAWFSVVTPRTGIVMPLQSPHPSHPPRSTQATDFHGYLLILVDIILDYKIDHYLS